ncbi:MAG: hypothetical protein ACOC16_03095 [Nanoarchaeota archaeon]
MNYKKSVNKKVSKDIEKILENPLKNIPNIIDTINISIKYNIAFHPKYTFYWDELNVIEFISFLVFIKKNIFINIKLNKLDVIYFGSIEKKRYFEILGIEHTLKDSKIYCDITNSYAFLVNIGFNPLSLKKHEDKILILNHIEKIIVFAKNNLDKTILEVVNENKFIEIRDKCGTYIGTRMGRPEKAKLRKKFNDETSVNVLFPVGKKNENNKNLIRILNDEEFIEENFRIYFCDKCGFETINTVCENCEIKTRQLFFEKYTQKNIDLNYIRDMFVNLEKLINLTKKYVDYEEDFFINFNNLKNLIFQLKGDSELNEEIVEKVRGFTILFIEIYILNYNDIKLTHITHFIDKIKKFNSLVYYKRIQLNTKFLNDNLKKICDYKKLFITQVKGSLRIVNKHKTVENISKGFYRAKYDLSLSKDGTIRYDMTQMGITHFKPKEIGVSIEKLKKLGYDVDCNGKKIVDENQVIEIFPQDVILPNCSLSGEELAVDFIMNVGNFIDDLLVNVYKEKSFYNFKKEEDTIGHLIIGIAPHTSAGIVGRIIGYSQTQGCFAHPIWHAAQRRNLDGDENGIILLMDGLLNFSKDYLPNTRGSTMDTPLVLTSHLNLDQIDDEVYGMDIVDSYPYEFYLKNKSYINPKDIKIKQVNSKLNVKSLDEKYSGYNFMHDIENINETVLCSAYKNIPTMKEKLDYQLKIAKKIRAVDENRVASEIIDKHFLKDIKGNLRKFSNQVFRCTNCNTKYRRPPLFGFCSKCNSSSINFTVHEGSIKKYMKHSLDIIDKYKVEPYLVEVVNLTNLRLEGVFGRDEKNDEDNLK